MIVSMPPLNAFPGTRIEQVKAAAFQMPLSTRAEKEKCLGLSEGALKAHWAELKRAQDIWRCSRCETSSGWMGWATL